jgi:membrane-bound serine protease (ClpP class)
MIHHPVALVSKLIVLAVIIVVLISLRDVLTPSEFGVAVAIGGILFIAASILVWTVVARLLADPESPVGKASMLTHEARAEDGFTAAPEAYATLIGKHGVAVSNLNPAGTALIDDRVVPVQTVGEFIDANIAVEVVEVQGAKIVVHKAGELARA